MTTRRQALAGVWSAAVAATFAQAAAAATNTDEGPLSALVAYQQEVVFGYDVTLAKAPLTKSDRAILTGFRRDAAAAAVALRGALRRVGGTPTAPPNPAQAPPLANPSRRGYLREVIAAEEAAVASYYTALQEMTGERHLQGAAAFMAQSGRRLVVLRDRAGETLLPRSFETGVA